MTDRCFTKDPEARLDYVWDWTKWLGTDTILQHEFLPVDGIVVEQTSHTDHVVIAWIRGGTADESYLVTCRITTAQGRVDDRTIEIRVKQR